MPESVEPLYLLDQYSLFLRHLVDLALCSLVLSKGLAAAICGGFLTVETLGKTFAVQSTKSLRKQYHSGPKHAKGPYVLKTLYLRRDNRLPNKERECQPVHLY